MALEGVDGGTVAGMPLIGTPGKSILMQTSKDDTQVPNLASFFQARSLGLKLLTQSVVVPFGFEDSSRQAEQSDTAWLIIDEHPEPKPPETNETFSFTNDAHENARRRAALQQQMLDFWALGVAKNPCTGQCDCAAGNCGPLVE
jgi:hypothetical protein